ncbi:MAG: PorT family protein [Saprospiraceae bacterium]|nr:PorT family protein [Saprospiraceae bacterium]
MKKIASTFCFLTFTLSVLMAQEDVGFRFGVQASPTWSWMRTNDKKLEGTGSNWGLKFGMLGEFYFAPNYALVTGLGFGFNQGGNILNGYPTADLWKDSQLSRNELHAIPQNGKYHYRLTYVEIPMGLKLRGGSDETIKYYFEIPVFTLGFLTRAQGDIRGTNDRNENDEDIRDDVNGLALSWGFGGGVEYKMSGATLVAGLSFQQQFTNAKGKGRVQREPGGEFTEEKSKANIGLIALRTGVFF